MSSTAMSFLVVLALLIIAHELILGMWAWSDYRRIKHSRYKERTRRQFAEARNKLMHGVMSVERSVDPDSLSFNSFYYINTAFMRNPDQYREISGDLVALFLDQHNSSSGEELWAESKEWTPVFKESVKATADALGYLVLDYSWTIRWAFKIERRLNPTSTNPFHFMRRMSSRLEQTETEKPILKIRETQSTLYQMVGESLPQAA